ncbi:MAG TPA: tryptophan 2,3-dioxygenase family protein [Bryobacteraceae bacterium]
MAGDPKFEGTDQRPGLPPADEITYWRYLQLDTLLNLQQPRTDSADEKPFIILHQIAELLFTLIIHELEQITETEGQDPEHWRVHLLRVVQYFKFLTAQLGLTAKGVEKREFQKFRHTLFPASGFQSFQYRKIEILSARLYDLTVRDDRDRCTYASPIEQLLECLYWRRVGAVSGEGKNATLVNFEERYLRELTELAYHCARRNVAARYEALPAAWKSDQSIVDLLRRYDRLANRTWPQLHFRLAMDFLSDGAAAQESSGGTDWRVYLQAKQRHIRFFPELLRETDR